MSMEVLMPLEDGPNWLAGLEFSENIDGGVRITVRKNSGADYGHVVMSRDKFERLFALMELSS
jgi:hypothetical protein